MRQESNDVQFVLYGIAVNESLLPCRQSSEESQLENLPKIALYTPFCVDLYLGLFRKQNSKYILLRAPFCNQSSPLLYSGSNSKESQSISSIHCC